MDCTHTLHACAVCWEKMRGHSEWYLHATEVHGAVMAEFGYDQPRKRDCPGEQHAKHLPGYGQARIKRSVDLGAPIRARDGNTYTPIPLPWSA